MIKRIVPAAVFAMFAVLSGAAKAASPPESGTYSFAVANGHISGPATCKNSELFLYYDGGTFLFWPGLSAPGAVLRKVEGAGSLRVTTLPMTPAASAVWQGPITTHLFPNDTSPNTGKWSATLTFVDANSFLLHYTLTAGGCTLTNDTVLIRTGP